MTAAGAQRYSPRREPRHERLEVRGHALGITHWGPASANPVVLLHGWADTADTFQFMVDELQADWPLAALDWRGFGRSDWSPNGYWFPDYLADLDMVLDHLCPAHPATLVGHSMGGNIAMLYGGIRPERVQRIVNLEGFGLARTEAAQAPARFRQWMQQLREGHEFSTYGSAQELADRLCRRNSRLDPVRALFIAESWSVVEDDHVRLRADPSHKQVSPYLYRRDEAEACWQQIVAPVLLVLAGKSEMLARLGDDGSNERFRATVRNLRIEVMQDLGHMFHHEAPAEVAAVVEAFLLEGAA